MCLRGSTLSGGGQKLWGYDEKDEEESNSRMIENWEKLEDNIKRL